MKKEIKFPDGFLWGAATSAHQIEGGNRNNWSEWEKKNAKRLSREAGEKWQYWQQRKFPEMFESENYISGKACDHYNRYEDDFDIAKELEHNAHRFSIEWSRIEPEEGKFDRAEIEHYRKVLQALKKRNIKPMVTLWHWTSPVWLVEKGGESSRKFPFYFERYAKFIAEELGDLIDFWITLNEPTSVIASSYTVAAWPPQKKNPFMAMKVFRVLAKAHRKAFDQIHEIRKDAKVGFANILSFYSPQNKESTLDKLSARFARHIGNREFMNLTGGKHDFLAIQFYFHNKVKFPTKVDSGSKDSIVSDLGWEICPKGLYYILKKFREYNLPIYITENGLADADDNRREKFIKDHLYWINKAMKEGVDVRGYFYWSLLDNFEWDKGFWPRFGLVKVNFKTMEREIRPSARKYAEICKNNGFFV